MRKCIKGKLSDERHVAIKVLSKSKGNGEEFLNEVVSISRTSHVNVVTLLRFCYERTKIALIYEFMPNGSPDQFIYLKKSSNTRSQLEWKTLYRIAVGIARGLEYLHIGCNTRILHFDIKPHIILLDEEFCPKISNFGLAKLCQRNESIISMLGARGTAGYIALEVFNRHFGGVSYKSDVYIYGMMVLEIVGGRRNIEGGVSRISEIYFPHWIFKYLEPCKYGVKTYLGNNRRGRRRNSKEDDFSGIVVHPDETIRLTINDKSCRDVGREHSINSNSAKALLVICSKFTTATFIHHISIRIIIKQ